MKPKHSEEALHVERDFSNKFSFVCVFPLFSLFFIFSFVSFSLCLGGREHHVSSIYVQSSHLSHNNAKQKENPKYPFINNLTISQNMRLNKWFYGEGESWEHSTRMLSIIMNMNLFSLKVVDSVVGAWNGNANRMVTVRV